MNRRLIAEVAGTFVLVLGGCGTAVLAGKDVGNLGVAFAFGLTVLTMVYAVGGISGGHFNPAVTLGLWCAKRCDTKDVLPYIVSQVVGATIAAAVIAAIDVGRPGHSIRKSGFAANGYGVHSPDHFKLASALICEIVLTGVFVVVILGSTSARVPAGFAPIAIGLALTLIHLISIPVTNTSVNPARSTSQAIFVGGWALKQLWLFWVAPLAGAAIAGFGYKALLEDKPEMAAAVA